MLRIPDPPDDWLLALSRFDGEALWRNIKPQIEASYGSGEVLPPAHQLWTALELCPFESVRIVVLGQDPYHRAGQAHGLAFSVPTGIAPPPSLRSIFKELRSDTGLEPPKSGDLSGWA
ncbi:MAG: uracil-DNA glycosylase, partial [Bacteroidota bacterium]